MTTATKPKRTRKKGEAAQQAPAETQEQPAEAKAAEAAAAEAKPAENPPAAPVASKEPEGPSLYTKAEQSHYHEIVQRTARVQELRRVAIDKRRIAKDARQEADAAADELHKFIRQGPDQQATLPFGDSDAKPPSVRRAARKAPKGDQSGEAAEPIKKLADESWKELPLEQAGIYGGSLVALHTAGIRTIGGLAQYTSEGRKLTEIKGIGPQGAERIVERMERFWAENERYQKPDAAAAPAVSDQDQAAAEAAELFQRPEVVFTGKAKRAGIERPNSWPPGKIPARVMLTRGVAGCDNEEFGLYQEVERDVVKIVNNAPCVLDNKKRTVQLSSDGYVIVAWVDEAPSGPSETGERTQETA